MTDTGGARTRAVSWYLVAAVATLACGAWQGQWLAQILAGVGFVVLPGMVVLATFGPRSMPSLARFATASALGMVVMMLVGVVASSIGPLIGVERPLDRWPQYVIYTVLLMCGYVYETRRGVAIINHGSDMNWQRISVNLLLGGTLPFLAVIGAERLNRGNGGGVAMLTLVGAWVSTLVFLLATLMRRFERFVMEMTSLLYGIALSIVWAISMRGEWLFGWDIQKEHSVAAATSSAGRWLRTGAGDAYNSMLSITAMPAQLQSLTGISIEWVLRGAFPAIVALIPVLVLSSLLRRVALRHAGPVVIALVAAGRAFPQQIPAIARQEIAMFLFTVAVGVLVGLDLSLRARKALFAVLIAAIAFTHYTTSYATLVMCVLAWAYVVISLRKTNPLRLANVITLPVVTTIAVATLGWNLVIAPSGVFFDEPLHAVSDSGVQILGNQDRGASLLERWVGGSGARRGTVGEYAKELESLRADGLQWMVPDTDLARFEVNDSKAATVSGPLAAHTGKWVAAYTIIGQILVLLAVVGVVRMLLRRRWREDGVSVDLVGLFIGALVINGLLRVSSWAAEFYNPERAALHNSIVIVYAVALVIERFGSKRAWLNVAVAGAAAGLSFGAWGLVPHVFSGAPRAAVATFSEDVERFIITENERRAVSWMDETIERGVVQTDRYGQVALLGKAATIRFGVVDILHPAYIDERSWVYATRSNIVNGRARGLKGGVFAIFESPVSALDEDRSIVHATGDSRVYR